jgi:hypothetical protein
MSTLVNILILFFVFLIMYQLFLATNIIEGFENEYKNYDMNNPNNTLILAQQNAGNIDYLKERLDKFDGIYQQVQDLSSNIISLQEQVDGIMQAQKDYADQMTGGTEPEITGTTDENDSEDLKNNNLFIAE